MRQSIGRSLFVIGVMLLATLTLSACGGGQPQTKAETKGEIQTYKGTHTVRHSTAPLPSAAEPRQDGRYTLVWFSATW